MSETFREIMDGAWLLYRAGDLPGAERAYRRAVEIDPSVAEAWYLLGAIEQVQRKPVEAEAHCRMALALAPQHAGARNNLGVLLLTRREAEEAAECFRAVLRVQPDHVDAYSNLGTALQMLGKHEEAVECYRLALEGRPGHVDAHSNLGNALRQLGQLPAAIACYDEAARLAPEHPQVRLSRGLAWLQTGDFARGWVEHEWRFKCPGFALPEFDRPCWDGSSLGGRPILLYADHGLGDALQFIRYARAVRKRGGKVVVACRKPLERILATAPGVWRVAPEGSPISEVEVYAPLMSLPRIFETRLETIPAEVPYLSPIARLVQHWRHAFRWRVGNDFKVGVAWQGNPGHAGDRERSFRLEQLEPLARVPGVRLVGLQQGAGLEQIESLGDRFEVIELGSRQSDLMDTAALMKSLDLVIVPDTSLAHLAGAIGIPVWLALPVAPDWRWMLGRDDSPWYPTMRLFRQARWGDWDELFQRMAAELERRIRSR